MFKRKASGAFLLVGMVFLVIGLATDNKIFSWAALALLLLFLLSGGRWLRRRRR
ncbi:MAG: hypothetical protein Fur002_14710 [Anaerolineales bacterium]